MDRYAEIKKKILHYAESDEEIKAVVAIGSSTRDTVQADEFILRELKPCFAPYDMEDVKAALVHTHQLFAKLARVVAEKLGYEYPDQAEKCAETFLNVKTRLWEVNKVRVTESCAECLYDKQKHLTKDENYLREIKNIIDNRGENDTSPYLVYRFHEVYEKLFGKQTPYKDIKKKYNDLVLSIEDSVRGKIEASEDPLVKALMYARVGNYIDFGAMNHVDEDQFLSLLERTEMNERDEAVIQSLIDQCAIANDFLLITDNCGEIVLDKLFLEQLQKRFPKLRLSVLVRGGEVLNDATVEDAEYVGIGRYARVISNGLPIAGTVYDLLPDEAREAVDGADVILAKGQGNYESLCKQGIHIFYSFLCKCELFTSRFDVPKLTGIIVEERD